MSNPLSFEPGIFIKKSTIVTDPNVGTIPPNAIAKEFTAQPTGKDSVEFLIRFKIKDVAVFYEPVVKQQEDYDNLIYVPFVNGNSPNLNFQGLFNFSFTNTIIATGIDSIKGSQMSIAGSVPGGKVGGAG